MYHDYLNFKTVNRNKRKEILMAFDGIVTKKIVDELSDLKNYKIDKIYEPDKNTITLGLYGNFQNISISASISNNYRIHLTKHVVKNPNTAPNFCMLLRKHILGYKIKNIYTKSLERIVFLVLENLENPEKPIFKTLIIELMGKHSNIILVDENNIVIDSIRHTSVEFQRDKEFIRKEIEACLATTQRAGKD